MGYATLAWFRAHDFTEGDYPNSVVEDLIAEASSFIDSFTGMWFEDKERTIQLDGTGKDTLRFPIPIISISSIEVSNTITGDTTELSSTSYVVYNGIELPDYRTNPKIVMKSGTFAKGHQNVEITGRFGWVDFDPDVAKASVILQDRDGTPLDTLNIEALTVGTDGNGLSVDIADGTTNPSTEFNLVVKSGGAQVESFEDLSMDDIAANFVETEVNGVSEYITATDLDSASTPSDDRPAIVSDEALSGGVDTYMTPLDIVKCCRMIIIRELGAPLEDVYAQAELEQMGKIRSEKTDKHQISYKGMGLGVSNATGDARIDGILFKYKNLRPRFAALV